MLTQAQFNQFWLEFGSKFPAAREYLEKQPLPSAFMDGVYQSVSAFDLETLQKVITLMLKGDLDPIPNAQLGHLGNEIRLRCRQVNDLRRRQEPQDWQRVPQFTRMLEETHMQRMLQCAKAVDELLGRTGAEYAKDCYAYQGVGSVRPDNPQTSVWNKRNHQYAYAVNDRGQAIRGYHDGSKIAKDAYDSAIIMADEHTPEEEAACLAAFQRANLTWEQIQQCADRLN